MTATALGILGAVDFGAPADLAWVGSAVCPPVGPSVPEGSSAWILRDPCSVAGFDFPASSLAPHLMIAADVRLHNRKDLLGRLGIPDSDATRFPDSLLLLLAYQKWGDECGSFLLGEFAFAIWNNLQKRLFCCRDHLGMRPFFYWQGGTRLVFGGDPASILAVPGVARVLNRRKLAGMVVHSGYDFYPEDTFHDGIKSLPAASSLTIDYAGIRSRTYWQPAIRPELIPHRPEEILEALRELLFEAIDARLTDGVPVAAELSGGLDSSAVTSIAALCLQKKGKDLLALSAVLAEEKRAQFNDEREYVDEFRTWPNVRIEYVTAQGKGPFDSIEDPTRFAMAPLRGSRFYLLESFERVASARGVRVILQGYMGELGPSCFGHRYYTELATKFRWPTLIRELRQLRNIRGISPLRHMAGQVRDLTPWRAGGRPDSFVLLTSDFAKNGDALRPFVQSASPYQRALQLASIRRFMLGGARRTGCTVGGQIRVSLPLLDKRLVEFCLSAPPDMKVRNGYSRYLIRGSLEGVLPRKIQWRTTKLPFSPDYFDRYNAQLGKAREFVAAIGPGDPVRSVIDVTRLAGLIQPVAPGVRSVMARDVVPRTIYTICFLRQFAEFHA